MNRPKTIVALALALAALMAREPGLGAEDPVVAAAGDIACDPSDPNFNFGNGTASFCRQKATSDLLVGAGLSAVLYLGDGQYENGELSKFMASYDPTWGRVRTITRPTPGNHEYYTANASGYYDYFGAAAGDPATGWYSFDVGAWHVVVLNSACGAVGGCGAGSPQERWLRADLAAHPGGCKLATWHVPRFSSGTHGDDASVDAFWRALHDAGADVVLNGHDHDYERFDPQDPDGAGDAARGLREFVVGTGGKNQTPFATIRPNSAARSSGVFGVLKLTLHPSSYDWQFVPVAGSAFVDAGSAACHAVPSISGIRPGKGAESGGTTVTITGAGFEAGAAVAFGGAPALAVDVLDPGNVRVVTPAHPPGAVDVTVTNPGGAVATLPGGFVYLPPASAMSFRVLTPCRVLDTRRTDLPAGLGAPPIGAAGTPDRSLPLTASPCSIPSTAQAVVVNVTVVEAAAEGYLTLYRGDGTAPQTSTINFRAGQVRANNALLALAADGSGTVRVRNGAAGPLDLVIDVTGYFE